MHCSFAGASTHGRATRADARTSVDRCEHPQGRSPVSVCRPPTVMPPAPAPAPAVLYCLSFHLHPPPPPPRPAPLLFRDRSLPASRVLPPVDARSQLRLWWVCAGQSGPWVKHQRQEQPPLQWRQHAAVLLGASRAGPPDQASRCSQALSRLGEQLKGFPGQVGCWPGLTPLSGHRWKGPYREEGPAWALGRSALTSITTHSVQHVWNSMCGTAPS